MSVGAVNKQTGERIQTAGMPAVDSVLSGSSTNPVQNRVVKAALDEKADTDMVAADFNAGTSYTAGNYCVQDGKLYKFKNNHSGAWSASDVDEVKITGELSALKSGLTSVITSEVSASEGVTVVRQTLRKSVNTVTLICILQKVMTLGEYNLLGILPSGFRPPETFEFIAVNSTKNLPILAQVSTSGGIYVRLTSASTDSAAQNISIALTFVI